MYCSAYLVHGLVPPIQPTREQDFQDDKTLAADVADSLVALRDLKMANFLAMKLTDLVDIASCQGVKKGSRRKQELTNLLVAHFCWGLSMTFFPYITPSASIESEQY